MLKLMKAWAIMASRACKLVALWQLENEPSHDLATASESIIVVPPTLCKIVPQNLDLRCVFGGPHPKLGAKHVSNP